MGLSVFSRGLVLPLLRRFQVAEGMLLAVNASLLVAQRVGVARGVSHAAHSLSVLMLMYALNDWWDARNDAKNPRKDRDLARTLVTHRRPFGVVLLVLHLAAIGVAFALGPTVAALTTAVLAANGAYTAIFKGIPVIDVALVGVWGALFASLVGPCSVVVAVGAMTAVSHVFQAMGDRDADLEAGVTTTAVSRALALAVLGGCCIVLACGLHALIGNLAFVGFVPLALALVLRRSVVAWVASKAVFGLAWLLVLWQMHGHR